MPELIVYDSEGYGIGSHDGQHSERIQKFFFDGVRLTMDTSGPVTEMVVFFRARENETSRSEQYYAQYRGDLNQFNRTLRRQVEEEYGMSIVTTTEDTAIYELFESGAAVGTPTSTEQLDKAAALLGTQQGPQRGTRPGTRGGSGLGGSRRASLDQVKVGTGTYEQASKVVRYFLEGGHADKLAIAENADSPHLGGYGLVVEKGSHDGITLLGSAAEVVEQQSTQLSQTQQGQRYGGATADDDDDGGLPVNPRYIAIAGVVIVALLVGGILSGLFPFLGGGGDSIEVQSAELHGVDGVLVEGTLGGADANATFTLRIWEGEPGDDDPVVAVQDLSATADGNGRFNLSVEAATIDSVTEGFDYLGDTDYEVGVEVDNGSSDSVPLERGEVSLDLTDAEWRPSEAAVRVTGNLTQGDAPVYDENPSLDVTVARDSEQQLSPDTVSYDTSAGELAFTIADQATTFDLSAGGELTVTAAYQDAEDTLSEEIEGGLAFDVAIVDTNAPVTEGERLDVEVEVTDTSGEGGTETVELDAGELGTRSKDKAVPAGYSTVETFQFNTSSGDAGQYQVTASSPTDQNSTTVTVEESTGPSFSVAITGTNDPVTQGDPLEVTADIENTGDEQATRTITLDAETLGTDSVDVSLAGGQSTTETLTVQTSGASAGGYTATVSSDTDQVTEAVVVQEAGSSAFSVSIQADEPSVAAGEMLALDVEITNTGDEAGSGTVQLDVGALGTDSTTLTLDSGETATRTLTVGTSPGETGEYTATVSTPSDEATTAVEVQNPGVFFEVSITETNAPIVEGETLEVTAVIENVGDESGTQPVSLSAGEVGSDTIDVSLSGGESTTETYTLETGPGDSDRSSITVSSDDQEATRNVEIESEETQGAFYTVQITETNAPVFEGKTLDVTAEIKNSGDEPGSQTVELDVGGLGTDSSTVELQVGASQTETFTVETGDGDAGEYTATVSSDNTSTTVPVEVGSSEPQFDVAITEPSSSGSSVGVLNTEVTAGEPLSVTANITNTGGLSDTQTIELNSELDTEQSEVSLSAGESATETFVVGTSESDAGTTDTITVASDDDQDSVSVTIIGEGPEPALSNLDIAGQGDSASISDGDVEDISVVVENIGSESGSFEVTLDFGEGETWNKSTSLNSGESETVTFQGVTEGIPKNLDGYDVVVSAGEAKEEGSLVVEAAGGQATDGRAGETNRARQGQHSPGVSRIT